MLASEGLLAYLSWSRDEKHPHTFLSSIYSAIQGEVEPLRPRGLAPKRLRDMTIEQDGRGKQQQKRKGSGKEGAGKKQQVMASGAWQGSEWILVVQSWLLAGIQ